MIQNFRQNQTDPFGPSYPQSPARFRIYRIGIIIFSVILIIIGKSSLPTDSVNCIQDQVLKLFSPITNFFFEQQMVGRILKTTVHFVVDVQLIGMIIYWYLYGKSLRYPIGLGVIGFTKVLLNMIFKTQTINESFIKIGYIPSLVFGDNFQNTYFFSGVCALLTLNMCEFIYLNSKTLIILQTIVMVVVILFLFCFKLNFFMDIVTGIAFTIIITKNLKQNENTINDNIVGGFNCLLGHKKQNNI